MYLTLQEYVITTLPAILQVVIAVVIFRQKLYGTFPLFATYTLFQLTTFPILMFELAMHVSSLHYAYTFYPVEVLSIGLALGVIYEVFKVVLEPYDAFRRVWRILFASASVVLIIISLVWLLYGAGPQADRLTQSMNLLETTLRFIQAGLLILLFVVSGSMGLSWRSYSFGLALGYGLFSIVELVLWAIRIKFGDGFWKPQSILSGLAYNLMVIIWACYIFQPQRVAQPVRVIPHNDIEKWNEKLEELLKPKTAKKTDVEEEEKDDQPVSK